MDDHQLVVLTKPADGQSLCRSCYWSHIQKGYRESEELIFCCFGPLRRVPFKVCDCTDYFNKNLPTRRQMEDIALIIPVNPRRKPMGFGESVSNPQQAEEEEDEEVPAIE
jgi:hypothetical protein